MLNIVLHEPEIPHNTGAAGRLALATDATLHLIKPLGFSLDSKQVRRAGLDYWKDVKLKMWDNFEHFLSEVPDHSRMFFLSTKGTKAHWAESFQQGDYLIFGRETKGLPDSIRTPYKDQLLTIPMEEHSTRSLNLSTSVAIVLFEAYRQIRVAD